MAAIIAIVSHFWSRMIASKPRMPAATMTPATTRNATTLVRLPSPQPSRAKTVAVANVASDTRTVSQPTSSRYDTAPGSALPCRPKAARESTSVGADPRLPAIETKPTSRNESTAPATAATSAWARLRPKPSTKAP